MEIIIGVGIGLVVGALLTVFVLNVLLKKRKEQMLKDAENEGEAIKKDKIIQAKEKFLNLKENHEKTIKDRERKLQSAEDRTKAKEKSLSKKIEDLNRKEKSIDARSEEHTSELQSRPHLVCRLLLEK